MFTGLVEAIGRVTARDADAEGGRISVAAPDLLEGVKLGDSINTDGVCLTVAAMKDGVATFGLAPETLRRTTLGAYAVGDLVNLERAVVAGDRMGGHFVQGHVDGVAVLSDRRQDGDSLWLTFQPPIDLMRYVAMKGYVALDGVSLTVAALDDTSFAITLVPFTQEHVALARKTPGARVNLEVDILAKYVERAVAPSFRVNEPVHAE